MRLNLKNKFNELKTILKIQEQIADTILKKNLQYIETEIAKLKKVPPHLFTDADDWSEIAKERLDMFEQNLHIPNFINYDMLEHKDEPDIVNMGEQLLEDLDKHKEISQ
jgi:hypothetical protein